MITQSKETQSKLSPSDALNMLVEGNKRFVENKKMNRELNAQVAQTSTGQFPFAVVLSCIDSRVPAEIVFDQGIGDIFSTRVAGNIVNADVLGSIEYGCKVAGSKVVVVMGHTKCGAVTAACSRVELGNITELLSKITPSVDKKHPGKTELTGDEIEEVSIENVKHSIETIRNQSSILAEMEKNDEIKIVGANYSVQTGEVLFL
ncbi:MAG: carbonic anhydrase [Crocinitomicaceae bacterium]